jgi:hypothetical protein
VAGIYTNFHAIQQSTRNFDLIAGSKKFYACRERRPPSPIPHTRIWDSVAQFADWAAFQRQAPPGGRYDHS